MEFLQWTMTPEGARVISECFIIGIFAMIIVVVLTQGGRKNNGR